MAAGTLAIAAASRGFMGPPRQRRSGSHTAKLTRWADPDESRPEIVEAHRQELTMELPRRLLNHREVVDNTVQPASWIKKERPVLPMDIFKPQPSFPQSHIADPNYIFKILRALDAEKPEGKRVVELGCGTGALTAKMHAKYKEMIGIELDNRAMRVLKMNLPDVTVVRSDALYVNYTKLAELRGGPLTIVANLPFHVTEQLLFVLADHADHIQSVSVTMQREVAKRICARPGTPEYGIPSVAFQLYADARILFHIPPTAYFPRPKVETSYIHLDFEAARERRRAMNVDPRDLRNVTNTAFRQRRNNLKKSLRKLLCCHTTILNEIPPDYETIRASYLEPWEFVHLTQLLFGVKEFPKTYYRAWRGEFKRTVETEDELAFRKKRLASYSDVQD